MRAPQSLMDPSPESVLDAAVDASPLKATYGTAVERDSALEMLTEREATRTAEEAQARIEAENQRIREAAAKQAEKERTAAEKDAERERVAAERASARAAKDDPGLVESVVKSGAFRSMLRSAGTVIGREITRSVFGNSRRR